MDWYLYILGFGFVGVLGLLSVFLACKCLLVLILFLCLLVTGFVDLRCFVGLGLRLVSGLFGGFRLGAAFWMI